MDTNLQSATTTQFFFTKGDYSEIVALSRHRWTVRVYTTDVEKIIIRVRAQNERAATAVGCMTIYFPKYIIVSSVRNVFLSRRTWPRVLFLPFLSFQLFFFLHKTLDTRYHSAHSYTASQSDNKTAWSRPTRNLLSHLKFSTLRTYPKKVTRDGSGKF